METTKGQKQIYIRKFTNEEMEQYVHTLYMHEGIMLMRLRIKTLYILHQCPLHKLIEWQERCLTAKQPNKFLMTSEQLKWTIPQTH